MDGSLVGWTLEWVVWARRGKAGSRTTKPRGRDPRAEHRDLAPAKPPEGPGQRREEYCLRRIKSPDGNGRLMGTMWAPPEAAGQGHRRSPSDVDRRHGAGAPVQVRGGWHRGCGRAAGGGGQRSATGAREAVAGPGKPPASSSSRTAWTGKRWCPPGVRTEGSAPVGRPRGDGARGDAEQRRPPHGSRAAGPGARPAGRPRGPGRRAGRRSIQRVGTRDTSTGPERRRST